MSNAKLLGVTIDSKLSFSKHVQATRKGLAGRMYGIRELKRLGLNSQSLTLYYTANIRSVLMYACPVWGSLITGRTKSQSVTLKAKQWRLSTQILATNRHYANTIWQQLSVYSRSLGKTMLKIYGNTYHLLTSFIKQKTTCQSWSRCQNAALRS